MQEFLIYFYTNFAPQLFNFAACLVMLGCIVVLVGDIIEELYEGRNAE